MDPLFMFSHKAVIKNCIALHRDFVEIYLSLSFNIFKFESECNSPLTNLRLNGCLVYQLKVYR